MIVSRPMPTRIYALIIALCLGLVYAPAQNKSRKVRNLENRRSELLRKIDQTNQELSKIQKSSKEEKRRLDLVRTQIGQRKEVIAVIEQEMAALSHQIDSLGVEIVQKRAREQRLLEQYSRSLRAMQRGHAEVTDRLLFVFAARSFDEAVRRQRFLTTYAMATSSAAREIRAVREQIEVTQAAVNRSHEQKSELLTLRSQEKQRLEAEERNVHKQVSKLEGTARKLSQNLDTQRRQALQLERQIEAQIAAEIAAAEAKARKAREAEERRRKQRDAGSKHTQPGTSHTDRSAKATAPTSTAAADDEDLEERRSAISGGYAMNAEERRLAGSFAQNKGRLPMPVRGRYDLVRGFGLQQHNTHSRIQISNGGIDLRTYGDRSAYAVFSGVVSQIFMTPGYGQSVIVRHGNYLTVFANLANVRVAKGQRVSTGQAIGSISSSGDADRAGVLHFQIWHERTKLNPSQWLKK